MKLLSINEHRDSHMEAYMLNIYVNAGAIIK